MAFSDSSNRLWLEIPVSLYSSIRSTLRFSGRSRGAEVLYYWIFIFIAACAMTMLKARLGGVSPTALAGLLLLPLPALLVRRAHDAGYSGWWALGCIFGLVVIDQFPDIVRSLRPYDWSWAYQVHQIRWLILMAPFIPGELGENRFGKDPRLDEAEAA